jgi:hypothetical protein
MAAIIHAAEVVGRSSSALRSCFEVAGAVEEMDSMLIAVAWRLKMPQFLMPQWPTKSAAWLCHFESRCCPQYSARRRA